MANYLQELNDKQRDAVLHKDGPLIIIAGAGSGKTKVLTTRIAHLMNDGVDPFRILALTFTNKAAAEMKERIDKILGSSDSRNLYIGTFHSVFAKILRIEAAKIGYPSSFTIYDSDDSKSVIKSLVQQHNLDDKLYKPNLVQSRISAAKNSLISPYEYVSDKHIQMEDGRSNRPFLGQLYIDYVEKCFKNGAMDFDDLLVKMYELLTKHPDVLLKYQNKFQYVMIDEYQDTNTAQYKIVKLLAARHENICVVGDDAQSIYSFRGATIENILRFQDDYPNNKMVKLEQNYRCTQNIIHVANAIINNNKKQIPKDLWTGNDVGEKIKLVRTLTDNDEGRFIADAIQEQKLRYHFSNKDFAILYRTNAQSRSFEESLRRMNIPYKIFGGLSFYQRKEIKDFVAYLRFVANPNDEEAFKRIINYPARGIGKTSLDRIFIAANELQQPVWNVVQNPYAIGLKGAAASAIEQFAIMIRSFQTMLQTKNAYEVAFEVGKRSQLVAELYNDKTVEGQGRYENVQELLNSIKEYTETPNEDGELEADKSLGTYLQQITLLTDADNDDEDSDVVKLMTIHAAKGLEFPCVFAVGLEENIFPSAMSVYDRESLEEERRLFYVVLTRAKHKLWVSFAHNRYRFGNLVSNEPSRFIEEIPEAYLDKTFAGVSGARGSLSSMNSATSNRVGGNGFQKKAYNAPSNSANNNRYAAKTTESQKPAAATTFSKPLSQQGSNYVHKVSSSFSVANPDDLAAGMKVEHQKFGYGMITKIDGGQSNKMATIVFEQGVGEKKIMLQYAKLSILQ